MHTHTHTWVPEGMAAAAKETPLLAGEPGFSQPSPDLQITVAGSDKTLLAHYSVLQLFASCVAGLPEPQAGCCWFWDLSGLVLQDEAAPVSVDVVKRWLRIVYSRINSSLTADWPERLDGATRALLLFADAVGTRHAVMQDIGQRLTARPPAGPPTFCLDVSDGLEGPLELQLLGAPGGGVHILMQVGEVDGRLWLCHADKKENSSVRYSGFLPSVKALITKDVEEWLYLSCRLEMLPLARVLLHFVEVQAALVEVRSVLQWEDGGVFSPRVVAHMPRQLLLQGFLERHLQVCVCVCVYVGGGARGAEEGGPC